jgi:beta-RFAP synthase
LGLAVGSGLARLAGIQLTVQEIAFAVGRGLHSGIGIATFQHGGFVLDGGRSIISNRTEADNRQIDTGKTPPVLMKHPMPKDWFFVTAIPKTSPGFSGEKENKAFLQLPEAPSRVVEKISWALLMKMLPALLEKDVANFGKALTSIQFMVGDCFASVQGGRFANPISEKIVDFLLSRGAAGVGQSSWGPTVYGLVQGKDHAKQLKKQVQLFLSDIGGGQVLCLQPQNRGAQVRRIRGAGDLYEENTYSVGQR